MRTPAFLSIMLFIQTCGVLATPHPVLLKRDFKKDMCIQVDSDGKQQSVLTKLWKSAKDITVKAADKALKPFTGEDQIRKGIAETITNACSPGGQTTETLKKIGAKITDVEEAIEKSIKKSIDDINKKGKTKWDEMKSTGKAYVIATAIWFPSLKGMIDVLVMAKRAAKDDKDPAFQYLLKWDVIDKLTDAAEILNGEIKQFESLNANLGEINLFAKMEEGKLNGVQLVAQAVMGVSQPILKIIIPKVLKLAAVSYPPLLVITENKKVTEFIAELVASLNGQMCEGVFCYVQHTFATSTPYIMVFIRMFNPGVSTNPEAFNPDSYRIIFPKMLEEVEMEEKAADFQCTAKASKFIEHFDERIVNLANDGECDKLCSMYPKECDIRLTLTDFDCIKECKTKYSQIHPKH